MLLMFKGIIAEAREILADTNILSALADACLASIGGVIVSGLAYLIAGPYWLILDFILSVVIGTFMIVYIRPLFESLMEYAL